MPTLGNICTLMCLPRVRQTQPKVLQRKQVSLAQNNSSFLSRKKKPKSVLWCHSVLQCVTSSYVLLCDAALPHTMLLYQQIKWLFTFLLKTTFSPFNRGLVQVAPL